MVRTILSLAALASLFAGPALADGAQTQTQAPKKAGFDSSQVVCRQVAVTGSHLGGDRVCMTWAEWEAQTEADQKTMHDVVSRPGAIQPGFGVTPTGAGSFGAGRAGNH